MNILYDFLTQQVNNETARFYMPGHKGKALSNKLSCAMDITEIGGADSLFMAEGIILQSEQRIQQLYQSKTTVFSAGGSTLCIQTMLSLIKKPNGKIIAARNSHTAFVNACSLLDLTPIWVFPTYCNNIHCNIPITPQQIEQALQQHPDVSAVYITSPDYFGIFADIRAISAVCKSYHVPLLVDNAHGAHLKFTAQDNHPLSLGADMCCDSAHKTLPVLTGGAFLHTTLDYSRQDIKDAMSLFGSTSPSYLIMASLDLCGAYLEQQAHLDYISLEERIEGLEQIATQRGLGLVPLPRDHTRLCLDVSKIGLSMDVSLAHFRSFGLEHEYASDTTIVFLASPFNAEQDFIKLEQAIHSMEQKPSNPTTALPFHPPEVILSPRQAQFAEKIRLPIDQAVGKIAGQTKITCPPGVPIVVAGERIDEHSKKILKNSGIFFIKVVLYN